MRGVSYIFTTLDFAFATAKKFRSTIRSRCFIKAERRFELTPCWRKLSHIVKPADRVCKSLAWGALPSRSFALSLSSFLFSTLHLPRYLQSPVTRAQFIGRGNSLYFFSPAIGALGLGFRWRPSWIALPGPAIVCKGALFADGRFGSVTLKARARCVGNQERVIFSP